MSKDFEHEKPENWKWGTFYFNRNDSRPIVPKRLKMLGWTLNFAHPISYLFLFVVLLIAIFTSIH